MKWPPQGILYSILVWKVIFWTFILDVWSKFLHLVTQKCVWNGVIGKSRDKNNRSSCDTATSAFCEPKQPRKTRNRFVYNNYKVIDERVQKPWLKGFFLSAFRAFPFGAAHSFGDTGKNFNPAHIDPPSGFGDKCLSINEPRSAQNSNEFAIAVWTSTILYEQIFIFILRYVQILV